MKGMKTVFVIEDDVNLRILYEEELSEEGYGVITSSGNRLVLRLIRETAPDVLVMETRLKTCDGVDLLRRILNAFPEMPVVICSVRETLPEPLEAQPRVDAFVVKSTDWGRLKSAVKRALDSSNPFRERIDRTRKPRGGPMAQQIFPWKIFRADGGMP